MRDVAAHLPLIWPLLCCSCAFITPRELERRTDLDQDGHVNLQFGGADCDDGDPAIYPGAEDPTGDDIDADCDGLDGTDRDGDGSYLPDDCDDGDPAIYPDAEDLPYDGIDAACDGDDREYDVDGDAYNGGPAGVDCDDLDPAIHPGAEEIWYDSVDQDCNGDDCDQDGDGFGNEGEPCLGFDCDDTNDSIHPGAPDVPLIGGDDDCDGLL